MIVFSWKRQQLLENADLLALWNYKLIASKGVKKKDSFFLFLLLLCVTGCRDEDRRQMVWSASVPVLAENQSHRPPSRELPVFRDRTTDQSEGFLVGLGQYERSDGPGLIQHRAQRCVQVGTAAGTLPVYYQMICSRWSDLHPSIHPINHSTDTQTKEILNKVQAVLTMK